MKYLNSIRDIFQGNINTYFLLALSIIPLLVSCNANQHANELHKERARQYLRSVYGGDTSKIDDLITDNFVSTYPGYERLFHKPGFRGHREIKDFAAGFNKRWKDQNTVIHEVTAEADRVVLVWSFTGTRVPEVDMGDSTSAEKYSWGGVTIFHFDRSGKINAEVGLEDTKGPYELLEEMKGFE